MFKDKLLSSKNLEDFCYVETKKNVEEFFRNFEKLEWRLARLNNHSKASTYDLAVKYTNQPYIPMGKDIFNISAIDYTEEEMKQYISNYYWAKSLLSGIEQVYIEEYFLNRKYNDEVASILGIYSTDSSEYRKLKRSAVYKFADFLDLIVYKTLEKEEKDGGTLKHGTR